MPSITINGEQVEFSKGQTILQAALASDIDIPYYCYHPGLSIVASCRICLVEVWAPNPRNDGKLEPIPKLLPACQAEAGDGQVVYSRSPKAIANQKAVMEQLLINHPLDCPVCDQAGECYLQDYSFQFGRGESRFEETKIKQPKKDLGPGVLLYADRCIMCSRCVRFTREVSGTAELLVQGRGANEQIDVFPGKALDNELAGNVVDLCPVGALLDKDFLFKKRVWELTSTPSIDPITSSGDNIWIDHDGERVHRVRPRENLDVNKWWITDHVREGWRFIHSEDRLTQCVRRVRGAQASCGHAAAIDEIIDAARAAIDKNRRAALLVSPMLSCEDAFLLAAAVKALDAQAVLAVGPVVRDGEDRVYPPGASEGDTSAFVVRAEQCPNARGVRRVLQAVASSEQVLDFAAFERRLADSAKGKGDIGLAILTGGFPGDWATPSLIEASGSRAVFTALIDTRASRLTDAVDAVIPGATWAEKSGAFENATGRLQAFEQAIPVLSGAHTELETAAALLDRLGDSPVRDRLDGAIEAVRAVSLGGALPEVSPGAVADSVRSGAISGAASPAGYRKSGVASPRPGPAAEPYALHSLALAALIRRRMAAFADSLRAFTTDVHAPAPTQQAEPDMVVVEL